MNLNYKIDINGCWVWQGAKTSAGYGEISVDGKMHYTHRLMYQLHKGSIPDGLCIDHRCGNRACCNPLLAQQFGIDQEYLQKILSGKRAQRFQMIQTVVKGLFFSEPEHKYFMRVGRCTKAGCVPFREVPGITSILARAGLSNIENVTPEALARGTAVHLMCESHIRGDKIRSLRTEHNVDSIFRYLWRFEDFLKDTGYAPVESERVIFSKQHWYAGRLDCILEMPSLKKRKRRLLVEIKTNTRPDCVGVQLSAQKWAAQECGLRVDEAGSLVLKPNNYDWKEHKTALQDWHRFQEALKK